MNDHKIHCSWALLADGWAEDVLMAWDASGRIQSIQHGAKSSAGATVLGPTIPGLPNLHSHAFQRGLAGLTERAGPADDSFWTWRDCMYRFVELLSPDDVRDIASWLYCEMLKGGYTSVAEFHYLHHQVHGQQYDSPAEMSTALIESALSTGIRLTHLPVLYTYAGFDRDPLSRRQLRFANDTPSLLAIFESLQAAYQDHPQVAIGLAAHSLRATELNQLQQLAEVLTEQTATRLHLHIAEQTAEVEACQTWSGLRPVEWLGEHFDLSDRWCLVHATHLNDRELQLIADSGAVVGLCPTTEANLGDGIFRGRDFHRRQGSFGIGSDSHVCVSAAEELKTLEYSQRLFHRQRHIMANSNESLGRSLYEQATRGGGQAVGQPCGTIEVGAAADLIVLDENHPLLFGREGDRLLDAYLFLWWSGDDSPCICRRPACYRRRPSRTGGTAGEQIQAVHRQPAPATLMLGRYVLGPFLECGRASCRFRIFLWKEIEKAADVLSLTAQEDGLELETEGERQLESGSGATALQKTKRRQTRPDLPEPLVGRARAWIHLARSVFAKARFHPGSQALNAK